MNGKAETVNSFVQINVSLNLLLSIVYHSKVSCI